MVKGMEVNLFHNQDWDAWFWQLKTEKQAHGPFDDQYEAMANAINHYEGATLIFDANQIEGD